MNNLKNEEKIRLRRHSYLRYKKKMDEVTYCLVKKQLRLKLKSRNMKLFITIKNEWWLNIKSWQKLGLNHFSINFDKLCSVEKCIWLIFVLNRTNQISFFTLQPLTNKEKNQFMFEFCIWSAKECRAKINNLLCTSLGMKNQWPMTIIKRIFSIFEHKECITNNLVQKSIFKLDFIAKINYFYHIPLPIAGIILPREMYEIPNEMSVKVVRSFFVQTPHTTF